MFDTTGIDGVGWSWVARYRGGVCHAGWPAPARSSLGKLHCTILQIILSLFA